MQFQADMLGIPVEIPTITDTTALGAAFMAAIGGGYYRHPKELQGCWQLARRYEPQMGIDQREALLERWHRAVERARNWEAF